MDKQPTIKVLIADDQPQVCSAIRLVLAHETAVGAVVEAANMQQVMARLDGTKADLVLLDWELPDQGGAAALVSLRSRWPQVVIIALSGRPEARQAALAAGADDFVSKGDPPESLLEAVCRRCGTPESVLGAP